MSLSQDQLTKIILIRSIEECDPKVLPETVRTEALNATSHSQAGIDWLEMRSSYLFDRLPVAHRSIAELAKAPAPWTVPLCFTAMLFGFGTNLLGPVEKIHVVRNPVFLLIGWNLCVYAGLLAISLGRKKIFFRGPAGSKRGVDSSPPRSVPPRSSDVERSQSPWFMRALLPGTWQFFHRLVFGIHEKKAFAVLVRRFSSNWFAVARPVVIAKWKYMLHLGALSMAIGAIGGMYFRGLFQDYHVSWASTFLTRESAVERFISVVFGPSLFFADLIKLDLSNQVSISRLLSPTGDNADAWIHLFAITVLLMVVVPRILLAVWQRMKIKQFTAGLGLALDEYYGDIIEAPIRALIETEVEVEIGHFAEDAAGFVVSELYDARFLPRLRSFRQRGGKVSVLKSDLEDLAAAFLPELRGYINEKRVPELQTCLSSRVGGILKSVATDFVQIERAQGMIHGFAVSVPTSAEEGLTEPLSAAIGVSVAAPIALTFAAVGGGLGKELGMAVISVLLGTTGPVGFLLGFVGGALLAGAAWWFGKDTLAEAVANIELPAFVVQAALWESRFQRLMEDGRARCKESVRLEVRQRLKALQPEIVEDVMVKARRLWTASAVENR